VDVMIYWWCVWILGSSARCSREVFRVEGVNGQVMR